MIRGGFKKTFWPAFRIAATYLLLSLFWIYYSDRLLLFFLDEPSEITFWQTYKGWLFAGTSSLVIFALTWSALGSSRQAYLNLRQTARQLLVQQRRVRHSERRYRLIADASSAATWEYHSDKDSWIYLSAQIEKILGYPKSSWTDLNFLRGKIHPKDLVSFDDSFPQRVLEKTSLSLTFRFLSANQTYRWVHFVAIAEARRGTRSVFRGYLSDVSAQKEHEERLEFLSTHDDLTGLANRALLKDRISKEIQSARRHDRMVAVMLLDLDRFKSINDSFGHSTGDKLLRSAAQRLKKTLREADTVARMGGDEFALVITDVSDPKSISLLSQKILGALTERPYFINGHGLTMTASLGVSLYPQDGQNADSLLQNADAAMYQAKKEGRNIFMFYVPEMNVGARDAILLENELRHVVSRGQLVLYFQPKIDSLTGRVLGAEALLRWNHPSRGILGPSLFIPLAEETGLIYAIGDWVLQQTCEQIRLWQEQGFDPIPIAANISARQFQRGDLVSIVEQALKRSGIDPRWLELELTETSLLLNPVQAIEQMANLKSLGVRLALDDFGTGYSSLNYLRTMPFDCLKIDRSFISDIASDSSSAAVASSIIAIAHSLGLTAVAEGVETAEQVAFLTGCKCDIFQGYRYGYPVDAEEFKRQHFSTPPYQDTLTYNI